MACPGVSAKGMTAGTICSGLGVPDRAGTRTSPPQLEVVHVVVEAEMDLVDLAILMVVSLESGVLGFY